MATIMPESFDLFEQPFLSWRTTTGGGVGVGFRKLLADAHILSPFGDAGPQTTFAVVRVLLVLMHQTRPACGDGEWQALWDAGRFPDDWLADITAKAGGKFDLFDKKRPFMQRTYQELVTIKRAKAAETAEKKAATRTGAPARTPKQTKEKSPELKTPA